MGKEGRSGEGRGEKREGMGNEGRGGTKPGKMGWTNKLLSSSTPPPPHPSLSLVLVGEALVCSHTHSLIHSLLSVMLAAFTVALPRGLSRMELTWTLADSKAGMSVNEQFTIRRDLNYSNVNCHSF